MEKPNELRCIIKGIDKKHEGHILLQVEKFLRILGWPAEVYKETKADDSKVRNLMTVEKRQSL